MSRCQFQPRPGPGQMRRARATFKPLLPASRGFFVMDKNENFMRALKCRECGREYPLTATHVCEFDFGPLEVVYDYDRIKRSLTREAIQSLPKAMWPYRELLPIAA